MTAAIRERPERARGGARARGEDRAADILELSLVGNPIMHHLVLGIDPTELGGAPFALAIDQSLTFSASSARSRRASQCARLRAALHRRPRRRRRGRHDPRRAPGPRRRNHAARGRRHQCRDRARQPRPPARLLEPDRPGIRRRADQLRPARRAGRDRARAHRSRDARAALQGDRQRAVVGRPGFAAATAGTGVTGVCGSGIIEVIAEMYLAGIINQDGVIDGRLAERKRPRSSPTTALSPTSCIAAPCRCRSRRPTCARSSSRRPPCTRASAC